MNAAQCEVHVGGWLCVYSTHLATQTCCRARYIIARTSGSGQWSFLLSPQISTWSLQRRLETRGAKARRDEFLEQLDQPIMKWTWRICVCVLTCAEKRLTVNMWGSLLNFLLKNMTEIVHTCDRKHLVFIYRCETQQIFNAVGKLELSCYLCAQQAVQESSKKKKSLKLRVNKEICQYVKHACS